MTTPDPALESVAEKAESEGLAREGWAIAMDPKSTPDQIAAETAKVDAALEAEDEKP